MNTGKPHHTPTSTLLCLLVHVLVIATATQARAQTLGEALNSPDLEWTTGGDAEWYIDSSVNHDGISAARSGLITDGQSSWIETTVSGPCDLSFWWRASSEFSDVLQFSLNGGVVAEISGFWGEPEWEKRTFSLGAGISSLRWTYAKDTGFAGGEDACWLDAVSLTAADLAVAVASDAAYAPVGKEVIHSVTVTNRGPGVATGAVLTIYLPAEATLTSVTASQGTHTAAGGTLWVTLGTLENMGTATISVAVRYQGVGTSTTHAFICSTEAFVSGDQADFRMDNNTASIETVVTHADSAVTKQWPGYPRWGGFYDVAVSGNRAYAVSLHGLQVFDVSDASKVAFLGCFSMGSYTEVQVQVVDTTAYVARAMAQSLEIYDASDPGNIVLLNEYSASGLENCFVVGTVAYVVDDEGMRILDVSNPTDVVPLGRYDIGWWTSDVYVMGTTAYVMSYMNSQLDLLDVSDPANVLPLGGIRTSGPPRDIQVVGTTAYVAVSYQGLDILDISNPTNIVRLGTCDTSGIAYAVAVSGDYAFVADGTEGLQVIDISEPHAPHAASKHGFSGYASGVRVMGTTAYVADSDTGLRMLDVSSPTNVVALGRFDGRGSARSLQVTGSTVYVADGDAGLRILDGGNPTNVVLLGGFDTSGYAQSVWVVGSAAYVADDDAGLQILDVTNPANVVRLGGFDTSGSSRSVWVIGSTAYVADDDAGLQILDVSNPASVVRLGGFDTGGSARSVWVVGSTAYVADYDAGLQILDVSDTAHVVRLGEESYFSRSGSDVQVVGTDVYVVTGSLKVFDASNPASVVFLGGTSGPNVYAGHVEGATACLAAGPAGLRVFDVSSPDEAVVLDEYDTSGAALDVQVTGNTAYIADGQCGVAVVQLIWADLGLDLQYSGHAVEVGDVVSYSLGVTNQGPSEATSIVVTDTLPDSVNLVSVTSSQGTVTTNGNVLSFGLGTLTNAGGATLTVAVTPTAAGTLTNHVVVSAAEVDPSPGNNEAVVVTVVTAPVLPNQPPSFTKGADQSIFEDAGPQAVAGWATGVSAGPPDESGQMLTFQVTNDNNALFSAQPAIAADGTLNYTPAADANGNATVTGILKDDGGTADGGVDTSAPQTFTITVNPVNDAAGFVKGPDQTVAMNAGPQTVPGWATAISVGPPDESAQGCTFEVNNDNSTLFAIPPSITSDGILTYTPASGASGVAVVTVILKDSGGTANGGVDSSAPQTFTITVVGEPAEVLIFANATPNPVSIGSNLVVRLTVPNASSAVAQGVVVTNPIPANAEFVGASSSQGTCALADGAVVASLGDLTGGSSATVSITIVPRVFGSIVDTAWVSSTTTDPNPANNSTSLGIQVMGPPIVANVTYAGPSPTIQFFVPPYPGYDAYLQYTDAMGPNAVWTDLPGGPHSGLVTITNNTPARWYRTVLVGR